MGVDSGIKEGGQKRMGKDGRGYSLVELLIVIAVAAALTATFTLSVGLVSSADARACADDVTGAIAACKIAAMSEGQGNVRLVIYRGDSGNIYSEQQTREEEDEPWTAESGDVRKIGARRCRVGSSNGSDNIPVKTGDAVPTLETGMWEIYFDRSSGSFREETTISDIYIQGGSRNYHIHLEGLTGKATKELIASP